MLKIQVSNKYIKKYVLYFKVWSILYLNLNKLNIPKYKMFFRIKKWIKTLY